MSVPLKEATRKKWVAHNPMDGVEVIANTYQQRGIYTVSEIQKILDYLYIKGTVGVTEQWKTRGPNKTLVERPRLVRIGLKPYLATALAAYTGMRSGEIRALTSEQIRLIDEQFGIISVDRAVNDYAGQKSTKGKRTRKVPLKRTLCELLIKEAEQNPHQGGKMIFWSEKSSTNPVSSSYILNHFYKALDAIGITEEQRLERNIDFHSLRHTFNSNLRGLINEKSLRAVVGHESVEMSDRYTHETDEDVLAVGGVIDDLFKSKTEEE
jgi:integrase